MGDSSPNKPFTLLPPGCRFYPSEEQLICYYLTPKNNNDSASFPFNLIKHIDLYSYQPFDLPDCSCFRFGRGGRKRHWYCYADARVFKGNVRRRPAAGGYWRKKGPVRDVVGGGKIVVGTRKCFVYYLGGSPETAVRTDWVMYEYSLIGQNLASFVLCRVFIKSVCLNSVSEHAPSSCGEGSVATVRHVGVQHDSAISLGFGETKGSKGARLDQENNTSRVLVANCYEPKDIISGVQVRGQTRSPAHIICHSQLADSLSAAELMAIQEEDYIELDDLVCPLPGID